MTNRAERRSRVMTDYYDLGAHSMPVTTSSPDAQAWFDRGLLWAYGFNHEEAIRCFELAAEADAECAMAYWGIAYATGPNYNKQWSDFTDRELEMSLAAAHHATGEAVSRVAGRSDIEQGLIHSLEARYQTATPVADLSVWNTDYADALRPLYRTYPDDLDVTALFADALMNLTPWQMWNTADGRPNPNAATLEVIEILEEALADPRASTHPAVLHLYVHLMEMSPTPEKALPAADHLRGLVPDAGHLLHMPSHIDVLCGAYDRVIESNSRAIEADNRYFDREGAVNFYSTYRCHNYHFKLYGAMFLGQYETAITTAEEMIAAIPRDLLELEDPPMADWLEGFVGMKLHVLVRFGKWAEILDLPIPEDPILYCVTTALTHYAKGIASAVTGDVPGAAAEKVAFGDAVARVPETRRLFNNTWQDIFAIAADMLEGELEYRKGNVENAFAHLRFAISRDDGLPYDEPWGWMQPTRHAYGALLLEQGLVEEAEDVYKADLGYDSSLPRPYQHPDNVWSLHGLHECLSRLGKWSEAAIVRQRLDIAMGRADTVIDSSCFCRVGHHN